MRKLPEFRALTKNAHRFDLVKNKADESTLYVYGLIGDIGWDEGISAIDFAKAVAAAPKGTLHVRVNSPGGDVFEGLAMA
jgi:ATP-dependent Clp protease protease subunit